MHALEHDPAAAQQPARGARRSALQCAALLCCPECSHCGLLCLTSTTFARANATHAGAAQAAVCTASYPRFRGAQPWGAPLGPRQPQAHAARPAHPTHLSLVPATARMPLERNRSGPRSCSSCDSQALSFFMSTQPSATMPTLVTDVSCLWSRCEWWWPSCEQVASHS